jgi:hypothetical protein
VETVRSVIADQYSYLHGVRPVLQASGKNLAALWEPCAINFLREARELGLAPAHLTLE